VADQPEEQLPGAGVFLGVAGYVFHAATRRTGHAGTGPEVNGFNFCFASQQFGAYLLDGVESGLVRRRADDAGV
jgi:hypothetical protein